MSIWSALAKAATRSNPLARLPRVRWSRPQAPRELAEDIVEVQRYDDARRGWFYSEEAGRYLQDAPEAGLFTEDTPLARAPAGEKRIRHAIHQLQDHYSDSVLPTRIIDASADEGHGAKWDLQVKFVDESRDVSGVAYFEPGNRRFEVFETAVEFRWGDDTASFREYGGGLDDL